MSRASTAPALAGQQSAIEQLAPDQLTVSNRHPRRHDERQIEMLIASILRFGFLIPILVTASGEIVCGAARWEAAKRLGLETIPVIRISHLSRGEIAAYRVADNKLCELAKWDYDAVREVVVSLDELNIDLDAIGFEIAEAEALLVYPGTQADDDIPPETPDSEIRIGDVFLVAGHVVICGDACSPEVLSILREHGMAHLVFSDPPYNVPVNGHILGNGRHTHDEFAMASGEMSETQFQEFLRRSFEAAAAHAEPGALLYFCMDWRSVHLLILAAKEAALEYLNLAVFKKTNAGMGSFYRSQHELVGVFRKPGAQHRNNIQLGRYGRNRSNVWEYPGANGFGSTREADLAMHPTVKPTALVADVIKDSTKRGDIVLDLFGGSGTTLIAAERTGRRARLVEISPGYVETTLRRYEALFGDKAIHAASGLTLDELAQARRAECEGSEPSAAQPIVRRRPRRSAGRAS